MGTAPTTTAIHQNEFVWKCLDTATRAAPEMRGCTLIDITEAQMGSVSASVVAEAVARWNDESAVGSGPFFSSVMHVVDAKRKFGVSQHPAKKKRMAADTLVAIDPKNNSVLFHKGFASASDDEDEETILDNLRQQLTNYSVLTDPVSKTAPGKAEPKVWLTGKLDGYQDDLAIAFQLFIHEVNNLLPRIQSNDLPVLSFKAATSLTG